jgi:hypothetical protein
MDPHGLHTCTPGGRPGLLRRPNRDTGGGLRRSRTLWGGCQNLVRAILSHGETCAAPRRRGAAWNVCLRATRPRV